MRNGSQRGRRGCVFDVMENLLWIIAAKIANSGCCSSKGKKKERKES